MFDLDGLEHLVMGREEEVRPSTRAAAAYRAVREAVVTHELPAGQPLDEHWLIDRFGIGRTPLREALKQLTHEKFLFWSPRQAPMVRDVSVEELPRLFETRMLLEPQIATLAANRATPDDIDRLDRLSSLLIETSHTGNVYLSVEIDYAFHAALAEATKNRFLREASDNLNRQALRLWYRSQRAHGIEQVGNMHRELAAAVQAGDVERTTWLAREHVRRSAERQQLLHDLGVSIL